MSLQMIKSIAGKDEYVLLPIHAYRVLKKQIDKVLNEDYEKFELKDYVQNPVALARIQANLTQKDLADHLEVTQAYISKIENQDTVAPNVLNKMIKAIKKLKELLGS